MGSNEIDVVDNGAIVKVFLLEGAFPGNAPQAILNNAGAFFSNYALTHAALGFLVEESESKHVVEFYASDYVGAFLPHVTPPPPPPTPSPVTPEPTPPPEPATPAPSSAPPVTEPPVSTPAPTNSSSTPAPVAAKTPAPAASTAAPATATPAPVAGKGTAAPGSTGAPAGGEFWGVWGGLVEDGGGGGGGGWGAGFVGGGEGDSNVTWSNEAHVQVTTGFDEERWLSANYVAKITGLLYNDLRGWAEETYNPANPVYQPLSACAGSNDRGGKDDFARKGSADSYDFVWAAFDRLAKNGVIFDQEVVLKPKRTVMCLYPEGGIDAVELVEAANNEEAREYYRDTGECVRALAAAAASGNYSYPGLACDSGAAAGGGEGGVSVMLGLGSCLAGHNNAFLYHNSSAYLRLPLTTVNTTTTTTTTHTAATSSGISPITRLVRYAPDLPPRPVQPPGGSDRAYIVYIAAGLAAFGFLMAALRALYQHRKRQSLAYGGRGGSDGINGGFGGGWRSGGLSGGSSLSGLGDFDVGGGYEGALFPADAYSSGGLSGLSGSSRHEVGPMEVPLLNQSDSPMREGMGSGGGGGGSGRQRSGQGAAASSRRNRGGAEAGGGGGYRRGGGLGGGGGTGGGSDLSPPPFSKILGTMGSGPAAAAPARQKKPSRSDGGGSGGRRRGPGGVARGEEGGGDGALEQGPFGSGGGGGGSSREGGSLKRDDEPEGDEVFC